MHSQLKDYITKSDRLERVNKALIGKERENGEKDREVNQENERIREELAGEVRSLREQLSRVKDELSELSSEARDREHSEAQAVSRGQVEVKRALALEKELDRAREERAATDDSLTRERERRVAAEAEVSKLRAINQDVANGEVVREELKSKRREHFVASEADSFDHPGQVTHLRTLEKENAKLGREVQTYKNQHANFEVLKESKKTLENKLRAMDDLRTRAAVVQAEVAELRREKEEWQVATNPAGFVLIANPSAFRLSFLDPSEASSEFSSPRKLTKTLAASRIDNISFQEKLDSRDREIHARDRMIGELEANIVMLKQREESLSKGTSALEAKVKQAERRVELRDKEVQMLKDNLVRSAHV